MKRSLVVSGGFVAVVSAVALVASVGAPADGASPVVPATKFQVGAFAKAALQASGRRVLFLEADPGKARTAALYESGRDAGGWGMFPGAPQTSPAFAGVLSRLAADAGAAWNRDGTFPEHVARALSLFGVKAVLVDDAGKGTVPLRLLDTAEPVLRLDSGVSAPATEGAADPVALAARLRTTVGRDSAGWTWSDWEDRLWGGSVTVRTAAPAQFVFPWPAEGARVLVEGAAATPVAGAAGPLLVLALPAGESRVDVSYLEPGPSRLLAMGGGGGLLVGLMLLLVGLRPSRAEIEAASAARAEAAARTRDGVVGNG